LCRRKNIEVLGLYTVCADLPGRILKRLGFENLAAERVVVRLRRRAGNAKEEA